MQLLMHRVVCSVANLIEQTQGTDHPSGPQTPEFTLTQFFRTVNNTIYQIQKRLRRRHSHGGLALQTG